MSSFFCFHTVEFLTLMIFNMRRVKECIHQKKKKRSTSRALSLCSLKRFDVLLVLASGQHDTPSRLLFGSEVLDRIESVPESSLNL